MTRFLPREFSDHLFSSGVQFFFLFFYTRHGTSTFFVFHVLRTRHPSQRHSSHRTGYITPNLRISFLKKTELETFRMAAFFFFFLRFWDCPRGLHHTALTHTEGARPPLRWLKSPSCIQSPKTWFGTKAKNERRLRKSIMRVTSEFVEMQA